MTPEEMKEKLQAVKNDLSAVQVIAAWAFDCSEGIQISMFKFIRDIVENQIWEIEKIRSEL